VAGIAFMILSWAIGHVRFAEPPLTVWPVWLGQITLLGTLIALREPVALAMIGCLLVVPSFWLSRNGTSLQEITGGIRTSEPWWLACMLTAALAVRW